MSKKNKKKNNFVVRGKSDIMGMNSPHKQKKRETQVLISKKRKSQKFIEPVSIKRVSSDVRQAKNGQVKSTRMNSLCYVSQKGASQQVQSYKVSQHSSYQNSKTNLVKQYPQSGRAT